MVSNITLTDLNNELSPMLPNFLDGHWENHSYERNGVVYLLLKHPTHKHEYESNMSEHNWTVEDLLGMFSRRAMV